MIWMKTPSINIIDRILEKHDIPQWVKPYLYDYINSDKLNAIKRAASFIDTGRKRGEVTSKYVKLPNGITFDINSVIHILSLFFYGEERSVEIYEKWSSESVPPNREYPHFYYNMVTIAKRHARAIKNLIEGLKHKPDKPTKEVVEVFDYIESLTDWNERMITTNLLMKYGYNISFGVTFYKVFYFVMPEYMRSFGKVFSETTEKTKWGEEEAKSIISDKRISSKRVIEISRELISKIVKSIDSEMCIAKISGIEEEAKLLRKIAMVYPFHTLKELGIDININDEIKLIEKTGRDS